MYICIGPIQPNRFKIKYLSLNTTISHNFTFTKGVNEKTQYAIRRSTKLIAHHNQTSESRVPRYIDDIPRLTGSSTMSAATDNKGNISSVVNEDKHTNDGNSVEPKKKTNSSKMMFDGTTSEKTTAQQGNVSGIPRIVPPKKLMKTVGQAIRDWNMICEVIIGHFTCQFLIDIGLG